MGTLAFRRHLRGSSKIETRWEVEPKSDSGMKTQRFAAGHEFLPCDCMWGEHRFSMATRFDRDQRQSVTRQ